jgi:hypothetical protein
MRYIYEKLDGKHAKVVSGLFLDLKKAFDTIDHGLMLDKLYDSGVRGIALALLESYFTNRSQPKSMFVET